MAHVVIYSSAHCPFCVRAKHLLDAKKVLYTEIRVDENPDQREEMVARTNRQTVPQIFINEQPIGGFDDMYALEVNGELDKLLRG